MKTNKTGLLIFSLVILLFDIGLIFVLNAYSVKNEGWLYIVSKCIALFVFIVIIVMGLYRQDTANYFLQYVFTIIFQFIPLIIRYLSVIENGNFFSFILLFICLIIYLGTELGLLSLNKKSLKATDELKGQEIEVKETDKNE